MFSPSRKIWLFVLACFAAFLVACGGASGTDSDKSPLTVCDDFQQVLEDGTCGEPPPLPACPDGQIRVGRGGCFTPENPPPVYTPAEDEAVIYYNDRAKEFETVQLYTWQTCGDGWVDPSSNWDDGPQPSSVVDSSTYPEDPIYGAYWVVKITEDGTCGNFIIRNRPNQGGEQTNDLRMEMVREGGMYDRMFFVIKDPTGLRNSETSGAPICIDGICEAYEEPLLAIGNVAAMWIDQSTIVWHEDLANVQLYSSTAANIAANEDGTVANGDMVAELMPTALTAEQLAAYPHLSDSFAYEVDLPADELKQLLKSQLILVGENADGYRKGTDIQLIGVLDSLYTAGENDADEAELGVVYNESGIAVSVWAPTMQNVELRIFTPGTDTLRLESTEPMTFDSATGIWSYQGDSSLDRKFYRFRVTGYYPTEGEVLVVETTDPYAVSLATNGTHAQFVNLADADLKPEGWDSHTVPTVAAPEAISIYEGHIRDFSIRDESTTDTYRGKYLAFTEDGTAPVEHIKALADAGINHMHLLPSYDQSSTDEEEQVNLNNAVFELCSAVRPMNSADVCDGNSINNTTLLETFEGFSPFEDSARKLADAMRDLDGFNWGYDPQHYNAPEGSYATDPNGVTRILEMRAMNMALHNLGMRVVMDVVYPHTAAAGIATANSTFDKLVPGYYYRTNLVTGAAVTEGSGAGPDTATERPMMAKFVTDSVVMWAEQYKVDGFRFDQSGLMPKDVLVSAWDAVKAVDPDNYFYGEAWTLNTLGRVPTTANQQNLAGTGIGTFNDVIRNPLREFDLISEGGSEDKIRAGLAGNLASFRLVTSSGNTVEASSVGAYNLDPQEAVNYVTKHDDETLWDWMHHPDVLPAETSTADRVRIQNMTLSVPILSQGVTFIHMGADILRSKSMSRNSYNAGDWFNYVDFTKQTNNWNVGLPPELRDGITDQDVRQAIGDPAATPAPADIELASDVFNEFLRISSGSPLFSLTTAEQVMDRVGFHDGGEGQRDNLIVMSIDDGAGTVAGTEGDARADLDAAYDAIVVIFNGNAETVTHTVVSSTGFELHPIQASSVDTTVREAGFTEAGEGELGGTFSVPAYTTAVFVKTQQGAQGDGLSATVTSGYEPPVPYGEATIYVRGVTSWDPTEATAMSYEGNGVYAYTVDLTAGSYKFKVADDSWGSMNYGSGADGTATLDTAYAMTYNGGDITFEPTSDGSYRFEVDATDPDAPVLTIKDAMDVWETTSVYVRGDMNNNGWGAEAANELQYQSGGMYTVTLDVPAGDHAFKVASADWSTVDYTSAEASNNTLSAGDTVALARLPGAHNMVLSAPAPASYLFTVDMSDPDAPTLTVEAQ